MSEENSKLVHDLAKALLEVKQQNEAQSKLIYMMIGRIDRVEHWMKSLWGNGSGVPGYLENARREDRERYDELFQAISDLKARDAREDGKTEQREQQRKEGIEKQRLDSELKTSRAERWKHYCQIIGWVATAFGGSWVLNVARPLFKAFFDWVTK